MTSAPFIHNECVASDTGRTVRAVRLVQRPFGGARDGTTPGISYDTPSANYKSHADIVVAREASQIAVIGGNVGKSVTLKHLAIDDAGLLSDDQFEWFAVLQNRLDS